MALPLLAGAVLSPGLSLSVTLMTALEREGLGLEATASSPLVTLTVMYKILAHGSRSLDTSTPFIPSR